MFFAREKVVVRSREDHNISRRNIDPDALRVLYRLSNAGFTAYLVGGSVRDLLMGRQPKDFDVGTDAHPGQIRKLFRNCFLVGRRFRLAHILFGRKAIETSTFRKPPPADEADEGVPGGLYQHEDNTFGTPEEDARRRDFTVNGLFYDIRTFSVIDYVGGLRDLERRTLRTIGDPNIRFREDPVRMMRAVRFAARLDFRIEWSCRRAIRRHYPEIVHASTPRVLEEIMRLFGHRAAAPAFRLLWEYGLMSVLLPEVHAFVESGGGGRSPLWAHLAALDAERDSEALSSGLRLAALYAPMHHARLREAAARGEHAHGLAVAQALLQPLSQRMRLPRQTYYTACMLLDAQRRFEEGGRRPRRQRLARHELFRDAIALRRIALAASGGDAGSLREWEEIAQRAAIRPPEREEHALPAPPPAAAHGAPPPGPAEQGSEAPGFEPRRRRRRRGGRRHRRPHEAVPAGDAASPADAPAPTPAPAAAPPSAPTPAPRPVGEGERPADAG
jgi:poly(A) polymerase